MNTQINFDSLKILGWYDGVTLAVGKHGGSYYLVLMVACQVPTNQRISAILPIDETFAQALISFPADTTIPENLAAFRELLDSGLLAHHGDAYLTADQIEKDKTIKIYRDPEFKPGNFVPLDDDAPFDDLLFERWLRRLEELRK